MKYINRSFYIILLFGFFIIFFISGTGCQKKDKKLNVILISLDTTRNDFIDTGKGARARTPEIKRFAQDSLVFENAFTPTPQTLPAHLAALTSHLPHELGVLNNGHVYDNRYPMIQELLRNQGYETAAIISLGTISKKTGISKGFNLFDDSPFNKETFFVPAETVAARAIDTIRRLETYPFFLFVHFSDPHTPYAPPGTNINFNISIDDKLECQFNGYHGAIFRKTDLPGFSENT